MIGPLRWVKSERVDSDWHLTFEGHTVLCGKRSWGGPPLRPHVRAFASGPPNRRCQPCLRAITEMLGLAEPPATAGVPVS